MSFLTNELPVIKSNQVAISADLKIINSTLADILEALARIELAMTPSEVTVPAPEPAPPVAVFPASTITQFNINEGIMSGNPSEAPVRRHYFELTFAFRWNNLDTGHSEIWRN